MPSENRKVHSDMEQILVFGRHFLLFQSQKSESGNAKNEWLSCEFVQKEKKSMWKYFLLNYFTKTYNDIMIRISKNSNIILTFYKISQQKNPNYPTILGRIII